MELQQRSIFGSLEQKQKTKKKRNRSYQVTNTVEAVEGEGVGNQELSSNLGGDGDGGDGRGDGGGIETETEHREDSVADGTSVETCQRREKERRQLMTQGVRCVFTPSCSIFSDTSGDPAAIERGSPYQQRQHHQ